MGEIQQLHRAAIYVRQSQTDDGSISAELQEANCRKLAERYEWQVTKVYDDLDITGGSTKKRNAYRDLKADFEAGKFDILLADDLSRFNRNTAESAMLHDLVPTATWKEGIQENRLFTDILSAFNADFLRKISERWSDALARRLQHGLPASGKAHFGYTRIDPNGKPIGKANPKARGVLETYVINEEEAAVVREAYARYTAGEGARTICEDFTARGLSSAGPAGWHPNGLFDLLDKSFYSGTITHDGKDFPGAHEPLLTPAQWAAYRKAREARKTYARPRNTKWMLHGLVVCGRCGGKMLSHMARGVPNLMCGTYNKQGKAGCPGTFRKREIVMKKFRFWLFKHQQEWADAMPSDDEARIAAETAVADAQTACDSAVEDYSRYQQWAYENGIVAAVSAKTLAEKAEAITASEKALEEAQAELGSFVPASTLREQINAGIKVLGLDVPENDPSLEEPPTEAETAIMREIYAKMIDRIIVLPPSHTSPRHPDRDLMAEIEVVPRSLPAKVS